jgi:hypothetical protein
LDSNCAGCKNKNWPMGMHQIKKVLHIIGNTRNKRLLTKWDKNLWILVITWRINIQSIWRAQKLNTKRTNDPTKKWTNWLNSQFLKEIKIANECTRQCSTFLAIKEMQITMTLWFHLTPVRMDIIKKSQPTNAGENAEKRSPHIPLVGM